MRLFDSPRNQIPPQPEGGYTIAVSPTVTKRQLRQEIRAEIGYLRKKNPGMSDRQIINAQLAEVSDPDQQGEYYHKLRTQALARRQGETRITRLRRVGLAAKSVDQVRHFIEAPTFPSITPASRAERLFAEKFDADKAAATVRIIDTAIAEVRADGETIVGNRIMDKDAFETKLKIALKGQQTTVDAEGVNDVIDHWVANRVALQEKSKTFKDKVKETFISKRERLATSGGLALMEVSLRAQRKLKRNETPKSTGVLIAEAAQFLPIWGRMRREMARYIKGQDKEHSHIEQGEITQAAEHFGNYYQIPPNKNPLIQNPDLARNLLFSAGSHFIANRASDALGYAAVASLANSEIFNNTIDKLGNWSYGISSGIAAGAMWWRYRSNRKAYTRQGYSSSFGGTTMFSALEVASNGSGDKSKNAKLAEYLMLPGRLLWFEGNFFLASRTVSSELFSAAYAAWNATYPVDSILYTGANYLEKGYNKTKEFVKGLTTAKRIPKAEHPILPVTQQQTEAARPQQEAV